MTHEQSVAADPVGMLAEEFVARYRDGECPPLSEYTDKYPEHAERIRRLFPMLVVMEQAGSGVTADATCDHAAADTDETLRPDVIGGYRVIREVGRGGMGVVYEAEQLALGRRVALKVLPMPAVTGGSGLERFRREAKAAARLHHTNIVPVYEVGQDGGFYFYAMQFIQGQPLDEILKELQRTRAPRFAATRVFEGSAGALQSASAPLEDSGRGETDSSLHLTTQTQTAYYRSVARVGVQVAEALEYAHREGVVHRDIKPSNLLLDADARVWVTDFGLAQTGGDALTQTGDIVGTVRYMAPERFRGWADPRSDVYSLGLTLYELIALQPAFHHPDRLTLIHRVTHDEPPRLRKLDPAVPRDLETIVAKATDKEPERRYVTAADLAADLRRFVDDRPILARRAGRAERAWRWSRRNPVVAGLIAAVVVATAGGFLGTFRQMQVAEANERTAKRNEGEATEQRDSAQAANAELRATQMTLRRTLYASQMNLVQSAWEADNVARVVQLLAQQRPQPGDDDLRGFEWHYWRRLCHADLRTVSLAQWPPPALFMAGQFHADGSRLLTVVPPVVGRPALLRMWETTGGTELFNIPLSKDADIYTTAIASRDGRRLATISGSNGPARGLAPRPDEITVWDTATRQALCTIARPSSPTARHVAAFNPDGTRLAIARTSFSWLSQEAEAPGELKVWDAATGQELFALAPAGSVLQPVFSPDGMRLAAASSVGPLRADQPAESVVQIWDIATRQETLRIKGPAGKAFVFVTFSPDGLQLAATSSAVGDTGDVSVWDTRTGAVRVQFPLGGGVGSSDFVFSPDGKLLAGISHEAPAVVRVWDAATGKRRLTLKGHTTSVAAVAFSADGRRLTSVARDGAVKVWDATIRDDPRDAQARTAPSSFRSNAFSPDGQRLARTDGGSGPGGRPTIQVIGATGREEFSFSMPPGHDHGLIFSPDGRRLAVVWHLDRTDADAFDLKVWDMANGKELFTIAGGGSVAFDDIAFSPGGTRLAAAFSIPDKGAADRQMISGGVKEWDATTGRELRSLQKRSTATWSRVAYSSDGRHVAASCSFFKLDSQPTAEAAAVQLWDLATGRELRTLTAHGQQYDALTFSPDGTRVAAANGGFEDAGEVDVWDTVTGQHQGTWKGHSGHILSVAFSPDGRRVVTAAARGMGAGADEVKVWDAVTGQELLSLKDSTRAIDLMSVSFSPDGRRLLGLRRASSRPDDALLIWDATPLPEGR